MTLDIIPGFFALDPDFFAVDCGHDFWDIFFFGSDVQQNHALFPH